MRIRKIDLRGFGHFRNKTYSLAPGLNVLYGLNGSGKSTIHQFILAIFYGFRKSWTKSQTYREEYALYKPLDGGSYEGSLDFDYQGKTYRIYRNFSKNQEVCRVFDLDQSIEITEDLDLFQNSRSAQPGQAFFACNEEVFRQVYYMPQLGLRGPEGSKDSLRNYFSYVYLASSAKDVENFFKELNKRDKDLGKKTQSKSRLGRVSREKEDLDQKLFTLNEKIYRLKLALGKKEKDQDKEALEDKILGLKADLEREKFAPSLLDKALIEKYQALKGKALYQRDTLARLKVLDQEGFTEARKQRILAFKAFRKKRRVYYLVSLGFGLGLALLSKLILPFVLSWPIFFMLFLLPTLVLSLWERGLVKSYLSINPKLLTLIKEDPSLLETSVSQGKKVYNQILNEIEALEDKNSSLLTSDQDLSSRVSAIQDQLIAALKDQKDQALKDQALVHSRQELEKLLDQRQELEEKKNKVQERMASIEKEKEILSYLHQEMTQLIDQKDQGREEDLLKKASHYLDFLSQSSYRYILGPLEQLKVGPDPIKAIDFSQLSQGTQDLVAFSIRLAMADFAPKDLFFLMDETFNQLDTPRLKRVWALMDSLDNALQVLYFTSRKDGLYTKTANLINIGGDYE